MADRDDTYREAAVNSVVDQVSAAVPTAALVAGFRASKGMSPTMSVMAAAVVALPFVVGAVVSGNWLLLLPGLALMVVVVAGLMRAVNRTRVVGVTSSELIVMAAHHGELSEIARHPARVEILPYWDRQWLKVVVGPETMWVSRRAFGDVVDRLAAPVS